MWPSCRSWRSGGSRSWRRRGCRSWMSVSGGAHRGMRFGVMCCGCGFRRPEPVRSPLRLSLREREEISRGLAGGESLRSIARRLGRSPSTISREVATNGGRRRYRACRADTAALRRARRPKPVEAGVVWSAPSGGRGEARAALVSAADLGLAGGGVPRRSGDARVARDDLPVVVRAVPRRVTQGTDPLSAVGTHDASTARPHRDERSRPAARHAQHSGTARRSRRPGGARPLGRRPPHGQTDARDGDAGGTQDPLRHARSHSRTVTPPMSSPTRSPRRSSSSPNSSAARSPGIKARRWPPTRSSACTTGVPVYFCDPRSPWQRGSNENTNGLLRQYFPKRTEIAHFTQADLDDVAAELNGRPRQTLGWKTPSQALDEALR